MRPLLPITLLLCLEILGGCTQGSDFAYSPKATRGVLDLRGWNPETHPLLALDGDWEFSDGLIDADNLDPNRIRGYLKVPGSWNRFRVLDKEHGGEGTGTYDLKILLDRPIQNLALQINDVSTAYRVFANGKLLLENGKVGSRKEEMIPSYKHPIVFLPDGVTELRIRFQVSNFYHVTGGLRKSIQIGRILPIFESKKSEASLGWLVFGSTFLMGLYHLILYLMRRIDRSALWFGLFCIDVSVRTFFTGSVFIYERLPDEYWIYIHKVDILSFIIAIPLFSYFLASIFPKEFHSYALRGTFLISLIFAGIVVILPSAKYMWWIQIFQGIVVLLTPYLVYIMIMTLVRKREGSLLFLLGSFILFLTTFNDIFTQALWIKSGYLANWGLLAFLFSQTTMLSIRFSNAFVRLEELQKSLELKVAERTKELRDAKRIAEEANALKDTFISLVTHDLRSPLANIIGVLQLIRSEYDAMDDRSILDWLERIEKISTQSLEMISTLLDLNRLRSGSFPLDNVPIDLNPEIDQVLSKFWSQAKFKNITIENRIPENAEIIMDKTLLAAIFTNLVSNAIKFCREGGRIEIEFSRKSDSVEFIVRDTGVGIPQDMIPHLFSTDVKSTRYGTKNEVGTGLGLSLVHSIIQAYQGRISVQSNLEIGTTFTFSIPQPATSA
ncbi:GHKL domain protein [Leptospira fainei serovar Hurstbridge str. BUT 6]|uniref:histidine kinase n=1 Tax=Leptospira fainei serovar Hurstbridge str. BUT 6 TaxID=1193011 RepID=S3VF06_9LEPT|nr:sensor histidine kinase [Leptospira fainei]EPG75055.1 GHKL domain protein [Leptospira fainei serovar Hurstbridge str. BUT 6]